MAALVFGIGLWWMSWMGLDPTNVPQAQDFENFHFPSIELFATQPLMTAVADYPAAPFPLFYIVAGVLYRFTHSLVALQLLSMSLGIALLWGVARLARLRFGASTSCTYLLLATVLVSPYFRGQTVYANTDILALALAFAALVSFDPTIARFPSPRHVLALGLACAAVYTRQFYVFLPVYLLLRLWAKLTWGQRGAAVAYCGVLAAPVLGLVALWGGIAPPRFRQHATLPALSESVPAVLLLMAFYALPHAVVTLLYHRASLLAALQRRALWIAMAPILLLAAYLAISGAAAPAVTGGGIPTHALDVLPLPSAGRSLLFAVCVSLGGGYLAYIVEQNPLHNSIIMLVAFCYFSTNILYQRYFDPLLPVILTTTLTTRELSPNSRGTLLALGFTLEVLVMAIGVWHYRGVFPNGV